MIIQRDSSPKKVFIFGEHAMCHAMNMLCAYRDKNFRYNMCGLPSWVLFSVRSKLHQMDKVSQILFVLPSVFAFLSVINCLFFSQLFS